MKKYPKVVQCDGRGQIVIPKEVRQTLDVSEGSAFYMYTVHEEGILLKKIPEGSLNENDPLIKEIEEKVERVGMEKESVEKLKKNYKKTESGKLEKI